MTEEEIKQKAEKYAEIVISTDDGYYEWNDLIYMFRKGEKLMQKENDRLAKHILELQKDKGELTDELDERTKDLLNANHKIGQLEQQIEKMKNNWNCKDIGNCIYSRCPCEHWKLKE